MICQNFLIVLRLSMGLATYNLTLVTFLSLGHKFQVTGCKFQV
jgi:hypothetical protein